MMQGAEFHLSFPPSSIGSFQSMFHLMGKAWQSSIVGPSKLNDSELSISKAIAQG